MNKHYRKEVLTIEREYSKIHASLEELENEIYAELGLALRDYEIDVKLRRDQWGYTIYIDAPDQMGEDIGTVDLDHEGWKANFIFEADFCYQVWDSMNTDDVEPDYQMLMEQARLFKKPKCFRTFLKDPQLDMLIIFDEEASFSSACYLAMLQAADDAVQDALNEENSNDHTA